MLTLFSIPKAFQGHAGVIQRNAIHSWTRLTPRPEILLFGNEKGTAEIAKKFEVRHVPEVACNEQGTPLLGDLFRRAEANATSELLCFLNADIIVTSEFVRAMLSAQKHLGNALVISRRINMDIEEAVAFELGWEAALRTRSLSAGTPGDHTSIDIFGFTRGMYREVPDFCIGRAWFDQWLIKEALERNFAVVDATLLAPVIHQNHDYKHVGGGREQVYHGKEAERNLQLYGGVTHAFTFLNATHELDRQGRIRRVRLRKLAFRLSTFAWEYLVRRTARPRKALRLHGKFWKAQWGRSG